MDGLIALALLALAAVALGLGLYAVERRRLRRLLDWLRQPGDAVAPLAHGLWGEMSYRMERVLDAERRALLAEQRSREDFQAAIDASPNGVLLMDAQRRIAWLNTPAAEHFGLHPQRDQRQPITNLIRYPGFVDYLQAGVYGQPLTLALRDGRTLLVTVRRYGAGALVLVSQDISERERTEAMRRDFVANVSHEIRTPLAALGGFVESLRTLELTHAERARVLELMQQQSQRMQALVDDLLALARLEGSPRPDNHQWCGLDEILDAVRGEVAALSGGRHCMVWPDPTGLELAAVRSEVHSALANLLGNAVRYTPDGGTVRLHSVLADDGSLELSVVDTGPGIAPEHLPRLTERFYRVEGSRSRATGGTGLGLAIVKHIMQRHGGGLHIESTVGEGSCFALRWPALRVRRVAAGVPETAPR